MITHAIGIDFGGTSIKSGLVADGVILHHGTPIDTQALGGPEEIIEALGQLADDFRAREPQIVALGIGLPGIVDSIGGVVHELTNVPGWTDVPLRQILRERTGLRVTIENDANAMAYGEFRFGAAAGGRHVICITLGTGVGGALILDGHLYRGAQLGAGEIGHMSIDLRGKPGPYGNFGCLEEYVGNVQIAARAQQRYLEQGKAVSLLECSPALLADAATAGDPVAMQLWDDLGVELGSALASVVWILNPDTIVIGGGVAKAGELIMAPLRREIRARTLEIFHERLRIVTAALGNDAGIIGNAALALNPLG
ncbi:MAG TPA: ROK family protein [Chthoniobacteraceae bacterium]|jgi:glucokinase